MSQLPFMTITGKFNLILKQCNVAVLVCFLAACQTLPVVYQPQQQFKQQQLIIDDYFPQAGQAVIESVDDIFALTPETTKLLRRTIKPHQSFNQQVEELIAFIFEEQQVGLAYRNSANLTAQQAFRNREANCISLTIMAYAFAQELDIKAIFQDVDVPEYWVQQGRFSMLTGHVNLLLTDEVDSANHYVVYPKTMVVDFDPYIRKKHFPSRKITKNKLVAMFYNNKAAQAMVNKEYSLAYDYLKAALTLIPEYSPAWGNLGILYRFIGQEKLAIKVYEHAINLDLQNYTVLTNLAMLLRQHERSQEADNIEWKLHQLRSQNPYYHQFIANEAMIKGHYSKAKDAFKQAIKLDSKQHEFYFGLAKVYYLLNDYERSARALKKAIKLNKYPDIEAQYIAKLNFLHQ